MKSTFAVFVAALLAIPTITKAQIVIDGSLDAQYGSAIVTQKLGTSTFKNNETNVDASSGSELDAAYGTISNGVLYMFIAGNIDSGGADSSGNPFDKLQIFFMTGPGGDHTLGTNYNGAADFGRLNNLGVNGGPQQNGDPGLTFDTGFAANYWIGVTVGGAGVGPTMYLNREVVCAGCDGEFLGSVLPSNAPPANIFVDGTFGIRAAINNSNTNGVQGDLSGCEVNGAPFNPQNVTKGLELAIPLSAIGNPTGQVSICIFMTDDGFASMYNQVLGPIWDGTPTFCQGSFGSASAVNFSALPGTHTFTFAVPPCNAFLLSPATTNFAVNGGVGTVGVVDQGACSWTASSSQPWLTITGGASGVGNGTITYSVATNTTIDARTASIIVSGQFVTASATITEDGKFLPPLSSIIVDGIAESAYGCPIAVQIQGTGFGNSVGTNLMSNSGGSELDAAYGLVKDGVLFLVFAGNLENNNNKLDIFFSTGAPGQNTLTNVNPNVDFNGLNAMGGATNGSTPGLTFDAGFAASYYINVNGGQVPYHLYGNYAQMWPGGTNNVGVATNGYFLGSTTTTNGTLSGGTNPFLIQATINDTNTNGVDGTSCVTNGAGALQSVAAALVRSGVELAIPLAALGNPTGPIAVCAFINNPGHTFLSNQILGPVGPTTNACQGQSNLGTVGATSTINLTNFPGQHFFLVGPEMAVKSVTVLNNNATVTYQTEANANLLYRVERATGNYSTNNAAWTPLSGFTPGTGGIFTQIDNSVTSKTNVYYRVRQTPNCQ
ncbi:MAG TPA: BACON domain-containing protein [Verrucomicrobiae bacterium]|nr:BACON domain-containing protein [Verrucomicrobiae bacterium]